MADIFVVWDKHREQVVSVHKSNADALVAQRRHLTKLGSQYQPTSDFAILTVPKK